MMKKKEIIACLKANKQISDYEITIKEKDSRELFYVLRNLQINRAVKVQNVTIKVYVSDKKTTGMSTVMLTAADDSATLTEKLKKAVKQAKAAKNAYYPLTDKTVNLKDNKASGRDLNAIALKVADAVFKADTYKQGWINSTEIFVYETATEFLNSNGVDHMSHDFKVEIECIPTWSNKKEEFELYKFYESNKTDYKGITKEIDEILKQARNRSKALNIKDIELPEKLPVLVKDDMIEEIVGYALAYGLSYRNVYLKQDHYALNDKVSDNPFDLVLKGSISGCADSTRFDEHGVILKSRTIIKDGIVKAHHGDIQFGHYLKETKISGKMEVAELKAQGSSYKKEPHLIIESFSAPQLEEDSGYFGGEVRLAMYFDGKKYIPLTGLSISGNIYESLKNVRFSKEQTVLSDYKGPKYFIFDDITIS